MSIIKYLPNYSSPCSTICYNDPLIPLTVHHHVTITNTINLYKMVNLVRDFFNIQNRKYSFNHTYHHKLIMIELRNFLIQAIYHY